MQFNFKGIKNWFRKQSRSHLAQGKTVILKQNFIWHEKCKAMRKSSSWKRVVWEPKKCTQESSDIRNPLQYTSTKILHYPFYT